MKQYVILLVLMTIAFRLLGSDCFAAGAEPATVSNSILSGLRVEQPIRRQGLVYEARSAVTISFSLAAQAEVRVEIARHLTRGWKADQWQYEYLGEPYVVRTIRMGGLAAGPQSIAWDGLNEFGKPVTETRILYPLEAAYRPKPDAPFDPRKLTEEEPLSLFRVTVRAGQDALAANFRHERGPVLASRELPTWLGGGLVLRDGKFLAADWPNWRGRRYSALWALEETFPHDAPGAGAAPAEIYDTAVDSRGNAYFLNATAIYRFGPTGMPVPFPEIDPVLQALAPAGSRHALGGKIDPNGKDPVEIAASGAAQRFARADLLEHPGVASRFGGMTIDSGDNMYLSRTEPDAQIFVFSTTGKHLRTLKLPKPVRPQSIAVGRSGTLWVVGEDAPLVRIDAATGAIRRTVLIGENQYARPRSVVAATDGTLWGWNGTQIWRFNADGDLLPFTAQGPQVGNGSRVLNVSPTESHAPAGAAGFSRGLRTIIPGPHGDVFLMAYRPHPEHGAPLPPFVLLHYAADGSFLPERLRVSLAPYVPGNVFLDDSPAILQLYSQNLDEKDSPLRIDWTLTDVDGHRTRGSQTCLARASAEQTLPLVVAASEKGHYAARFTVWQADRLVAEFDTQLARIAGRPLALNPDSPFSVNWGNNMYLSGLAGSKFDRVGLGGWDEPRQGVVDPFPDLPEAVQVDQSRHTGYYRYARRWGVSLSAVLGNAEPYLDNAGGPIGRIYSFDAFYRHALDLVDRFRDKGYAVPEWHFWNEPNCFWFAPGPFGREFYGLVSKHMWCIIKARDRDAMYAADGDAGTTNMMEQFAEWGANRFADAITIHYPGNTTLQWDNIVAPESPEGKVPTVRRLLALRDRSFPGRRVWNTEEGWWGAAIKTPETGARAVARTYLSQIPAGMDQIAWFAQSVGEDPTMLLRESDMTPWPAYCAYATMTGLLEGAEYVGSADFGPAACAPLFAKGDQMILAVWTVKGEKSVALDAGVARATLVDLFGRKRTVKAVADKLPMALSERVAYVILPRNAWTLSVARGELRRRLRALELGGATELSPAVASAARNAATNLAAMNRLFHLVAAGKLASLCGEGPADAGRFTAADARKAVVGREGPDGYLCEARQALNWTERLARAAADQHGRLDAAVALAAGATIALAKSENPAWPGVAVNVYPGEPGEIAKIRSIVPRPKDVHSQIDEKFRLEIARKPGESFELELTVWDYYRHSIEGVLEPRLPMGWRAESPGTAFVAEPGKFHRVVVRATVPADTKPGLYRVGGRVAYQSHAVDEIHAARIHVTGP